MEYKYIFGPVPSRRLGLSLGVDLIPPKYCSFNCVYCESGTTTNHTTERKNYVPYKNVISELNHYLSNKPKLDYITFSGAGEPTLNKNIGKITSHLKTNYPQYKVALITNSSLLHLPEVRNEIAQIDLIMPSLDAVSQKAFYKINRPVRNISIEKMISGLIDFRNEYPNITMWLEVFIVPHINDNKQELDGFVEILKKINPHSIQLNTLDRPGIEDWVEPASQKNLEHIKSYMHPLPVQIIAKFTAQTASKVINTHLESHILSTIKRRPMTLDDICKTLNLKVNEANKYLRVLEQKELIETKKEDRGTFYQVIDND